MNKEFTTRIADGREKIIKGAVKAAQVVTSTMGPGKRAVAINRKTIVPFSSPDGAIIASNILLEDPIENIGATWLLQQARRTAQVAGDATTTTCAIASNILKRFNRRSNIRRLTEEIMAAADEAVKNLDDLTMDIVNQQELEDVATISANNNRFLGNLIADLVWKVGEHGTVYVENSDEDQTRSEVKKGYILRPGLASDKFFPGKLFSWSTPMVALVNEHIYDYKQVIPIYERFVKESWKQESGFTRSLIIFAFRMDGDALSSAVSTYTRGSRLGPTPVIVVNVPGKFRDDVFGDLSAMSGAPVISDSGIPLSSLTKKGIGSKSDIFGELPKVTVDQDQVTLFFEDVDEHIKTIKGMAYLGEREALRKERLSKLTNGVGYIYIGDSSDVGMTSQGQLIDDAQYAAFAALKDGYTYGGGYTLLELADRCPKTEGGKVLAQAFKDSIRTMLMNSDYPVRFPYYEQAYRKPGYLFNLKTGDWDDVLSTKVLDSRKAVECAIINGASVACEIIKQGKAIIYEWK